MADMFSHGFTWLKVAAAAYLAELLIIIILTNGFEGTLGSGDELATILPAMLIPVGAGLIIGFLINAFLNFRRAVLFYAIGHLIVVGIFMMILWSKRRSHSEVADEKANRRLELSSDTSADSFSRNINRVIAVFYKEYPDENINYDYIATVPPDSNDHSHRPATECYIVFTDANKPGAKFLNKYLLRGDSVTMVFHNVPTSSALYQDFLRKVDLAKFLEPHG